MIKPKLFLLTLCLSLLIIVPLASASVTTSTTLHLGYGNGTYTDLPAGTYTSIQRLSGVWYVNGAVYPSATPGASPTTPADAASEKVISFVWIAFNLIALIPLFLGLSLLIVALKNGDFDASIIAVIIILCVVSFVGIVVVNAFSNYI